MYIFDKTLLVGSPNVSRHSQHTLVEGGLLCRDSDVLTQARGLIKSLQEEPVTPGYIKLCKKLYKPPKISTPKKNTKSSTHSRLWIISTVPVEFSDQENHLCRAEEKKASKKLKDTRKFEVNSIRWMGKSRFTEHVMEGDLIVTIHTERNVTKVSPTSRVIQITKYRSFDRKKRPRMFIHIEEPKRPKLLSWHDFKKEVVKAGLQSISSNPIREIRSRKVKSAILGLWS